MTNKVASAKNYRDTLAHDIKDIRKTAEISDEIKKALSADEFSLIQKTRLEKVAQESSTKLNMAKETKEYHEVKETKKQAKELVKKIMELTGKSKEEAEETVYGKSETKKESKTEKSESPLKALEKERKTAAIAGLDRFGMKTDKRVEAINAIQFLDDKILIDKTPWAYENMKWGEWVFKEKTNKRYYDFKERKAEAKKQNITLPEAVDFENTFEALDLEKDTQWKHILAIILWEGRDGYCDSDGHLGHNGTYGYLGSVSECDEGSARTFRFAQGKGTLFWDYKAIRFVCRPLVQNS